MSFRKKREQHSSFSLPAVPACTGPQKPNLEVMDTFVRICMLLRQDTEYTEYTEYYASGSTLRTRGHLLIHSSHLRRWVKPPLWSRVLDEETEEADGWIQVSQGTRSRWRGEAGRRTQTGRLRGLWSSPAVCLQCLTWKCVRGYLGTLEERDAG